ncbi:MAG: aminopeptidase [Alkalispirochaeta sp.]
MNQMNFFEQYAKVVTRVGLNIQPGQELYVRAPIETAEFVPFVAREAYRIGARYVHVEYRHQEVSRARIEDAPADSLTYVPPGALAERLRVAGDGGASLAILGDDPMGLSGVDPRRKGAVISALAEASRDIRELQMKDYFPWCVISVPNPVWAARVFPDLSAAAALERLYDAVAAACRLNAADPVEAWTDHSNRLTRLAAWLTERAFHRFIYSAPGTDLEITMPDGQTWIGTEGRSAGGVSFIANIPTDEVFCAPHRLKVNGTVRSTRPLVLSGTNVGKVDFVIRDGRIVEASCEGDRDVLEQELDLDEAARYLGEIAFVSEDAPIARLGTTFYDGLYDENAGCHLAFGAAYANCIAGGGEMDRAARMAAGLNQSNQHADFTVGSRELTITAVTAEGREFPFMQEGRWSPETEEAAGL